MAAQAAPPVTVAKLLALREQAGQTRLAAGEAIRRAVGIYAQAIRQHAELAHSLRPPQVGRDQDQPAGISLAQLLQPLFAVEPPRPTAPSTGPEPKLAAVRSIRSREIRRELEGSLVTIHCQVQAIHHHFQLTRQAPALVTCV